MKKYLLTASVLCTLGLSAQAQDLDVDLCSANAQTLSDLSAQHSALVCTYEALPIDAAQGEVDRLNEEIAASDAARAEVRAKLNEASERTVKLDTKISSLIDDTNVSTDDTILILGVENYDSIKELQAEREALMNESLTLQAQLDDLDAAHSDLEDQLILSKTNLAAAQAADVVFKQSEGSLRTALTQANYVAAKICGQAPVEILTSCGSIEAAETAEDEAVAAE